MYIMVRDNGGNMNSFNKNKHFTACNSGQMLKQVQHDNVNCLAESLDESVTSPTFAEHNNFRSQFVSSPTKMTSQERGMFKSTSSLLGISRTQMSLQKRKRAFTLAEALIALAITGLVAAITVPTLMRNYNEFITANKLKKFYALITEAVKLSMIENDIPSFWKVSNGNNSQAVTEFSSYLVPYFKISKNCKTGSGCLKYQLVYNEEGNALGYNYDALDNYYKFVLSDGSYVFTRASGGTCSKYCNCNEENRNDICGTIAIDVNGPRRPNRIGKDIFFFNISAKGLILPEKYSKPYLRR